MKKIAFLFIFVLFVVSAIAMPQIPVNFMGTVTDADGDPVGGFTVKIVTPSGEKSVNTDMEGNYNIRFESDDPDTPESEGVSLGDTAEIYANDVLTETYVISDHGSIIIYLEVSNDTVPSETVAHDNVAGEDETDDGKSTSASPSNPPTTSTDDVGDGKDQKLTGEGADELENPSTSTPELASDAKTSGSDPELNNDGTGQMSDIKNALSGNESQDSTENIKKSNGFVKVLAVSMLVLIVFIILYVIKKRSKK